MMRKAAIFVLGFAGGVVAVVAAVALTMLVSDSLSNLIASSILIVPIGCGMMAVRMMEPRHDDGLDEAVEIWRTSADPEISSYLSPLVAREIGRGREAIALSIKEGKRSPTTAVLSTVANVAGDEVESGRHHIYRGTMTPLGIGLMKAYATTVRRLVEIGDVTEDWAEAEIKKLKEIAYSIG